jgi:hypothetical protein
MEHMNRALERKSWESIPPPARLVDSVAPPEAEKPITTRSAGVKMLISCLDVIYL